MNCNIPQYVFMLLHPVTGPVPFINPGYTWMLSQSITIKLITGHPPAGYYLLSALLLSMSTPLKINWTHAASVQCKYYEYLCNAMKTSFCQTSVWRNGPWWTTPYLRSPSAPPTSSFSGLRPNTWRTESPSSSAKPLLSTTSAWSSSTSSSLKR